MSAQKAFGHFVPARCMALMAHSQAVRDVHQKGIAAKATEAGLPKNNPPHSFHEFLGGRLTPECKMPVRYTIDEPLFLHLCVQASKAQQLDQKPLHELIKKCTGLKQATFATVEYLSHSPVRVLTKNNYQPIQLTKEELIEGLLKYIPSQVTMAKQPGTSRDVLVSTHTVSLNGKEVILRDDAITAPVEIVHDKTVAVSHVPVVGERRIDAAIKVGNMMQNLSLDSALLSNFNTLLQQIEKSDASLKEKQAALYPFLGSRLDHVLHEGPVTYSINEYEFIELCVQASEAQGVDQKSLYELIQRVTQGKKAERIIKYFSYDNGPIQRCGWTWKYNYGGEINLTGAELARCLFNYIQYKGSLEAGPSGNGTTALRVEVLVNGEQRQLVCSPKTKQMHKVDRATNGCYSWGVEIKGQKEIRLGMGLDDVARPEVLKQFNELVEKAHKK